MRIAAIVVMASGLTPISARAKEVVETVTVYLEDSTIVPGQVMYTAEHLVGKIFAGAGVKIEWRLGRPAGLDSSRASDIVIKMAQEPPTNLCKKATAFARPYQGRDIIVFYGRLQQTVAPSIVPALLAHVMVHEITHILQGINRHSSTGIMKAYWAAGDYVAMEWRPLRFSDEDVELIHRGLAARNARSLLLAAR